MVRLAGARRLPVLYTGLREFGYEGALIHFAPDVSGQLSRAADYVARILRGAKAGELPIEQASRFSLVVNLKVASALGIRIPKGLLTRADEVIH